MKLLSGSFLYISHSKSISKEFKSNKKNLHIFDFNSNPTMIAPSKFEYTQFFKESIVVYILPKENELDITM